MLSSTNCVSIYLPIIILKHMHTLCFIMLLNSMTHKIFATYPTYKGPITCLGCQLLFKCWFTSTLADVPWKAICQKGSSLCVFFFIATRLSYTMSALVVWILSMSVIHLNSFHIACPFLSFSSLHLLISFLFEKDPFLYFHSSILYFPFVKPCDI